MFFVNQNSITKFKCKTIQGRYCALDFETSTKWDSREDLVEWVKKLGRELRMCLVIRRSNVRYVSLVCEYFGSQREVKKSGDDASKEVSKKYAEWTRSKKYGCTFELVGVPVKKKKYDFGVARKW